MNPEPSVSSLIGFSWEKTKAILFPFNFKRWLKILVIVSFRWFSPRFHFIFLDLIVKRDVRIGKSFRAHKVLGNYYFWWLRGCSAVAIASFLLIVPVIGLGAMVATELLWFGVSLFVALLLLMMLVSIFVGDFILPIMYHDGIKTMDAWEKFISYKPKVAQVALYFLLKIGWGILVGCATLIVTWVIVVRVAYLWRGDVGLSFIAIGHVLSIGILAILIVLGRITLLIPIFFRAFALAYLVRLIPQYNLLDFPLSDSSTSVSGS